MYYPEQTIEIQVQSASSSAGSELTVGTESRSRRESDGAYSQSTAIADHKLDPPAHPHVDSSAEKNFQKLLSTHSQCFFWSDQQIVNLSLTGAVMARNIFEELASLTCVRK